MTSIRLKQIAGLALLLLSSRPALSQETVDLGKYAGASGGNLVLSLESSNTNCPTLFVDRVDAPGRLRIGCKWTLLGPSSPKIDFWNEYATYDEVRPAPVSPKAEKQAGGMQFSGSVLSYKLPPGEYAVRRYELQSNPGDFWSYLLTGEDDYRFSIREGGTTYLGQYEYLVFITEAGGYMTNPKAAVTIFTSDQSARDLGLLSLRGAALSSVSKALDPSHQPPPAPPCTNRRLVKCPSRPN